jgi:hypothetical protein
MTLKVTIQPTKHDSGNYPVFYALNDGVTVGPAGELKLVSTRTGPLAEVEGLATEFRIYAPGTWREINVEEIVD